MINAFHVTPKNMSALPPPEGDRRARRGEHTKESIESAYGREHE